MRSYDHLFFDLDNTLWDFGTNSREAMKVTLAENRLIDRLSSFDEYIEIYENINAGLWTKYHQRQITKHTLIVKRFSDSLGRFGIEQEDWAEINNQYLKNMALQTNLFPGTIELLSTLQEKAYKMYIITNGFSEVQHDKLINCNLKPFFSKIFISEEIKTTKPNRKIFEYALKSSNATKKKSIMIGDSWETDILGAFNFGIDQVMFTNNKKHHFPEDLQANSLISSNSIGPISMNGKTKTYFIDTIQELLTIL